MRSSVQQPHEGLGARRRYAPDTSLCVPQEHRQSQYADPSEDFRSPMATTSHLPKTFPNIGFFGTKQPRGTVEIPHDPSFVVGFGGKNLPELFTFEAEGHRRVCWVQKHRWYWLLRLFGSASCRTSALPAALHQPERVGKQMPTLSTCDFPLMIMSVKLSPPRPTLPIWFLGRRFPRLPAPWD